MVKIVDIMDHTATDIFYAKRKGMSTGDDTTKHQFEEETDILSVLRAPIS